MEDLMISEFEFDLQLFNDGTTDTDSDTTVNTEDTADTGSDSQTEDNFEFGVDDEGNLVWLDGTKPDDVVVEESVEDNQKQPEEEQKFTVKVDGQELEVGLQELLSGYQRQADYTRKTQALAEERRKLEAFGEQPPKQETQQQHQEEVNPTRAFYENLANAAKDSLAVDLGEEFDEFNPVHQAALAVKVTQLTATMKEHMEKRVAVETFESKARSKEPEHYDAIYNYAQERVDYLPYRDRVALEQAFAQGDTRVMESFFEQMRKEYYNSKGMSIPGEENKPVAKPIARKAPPVVERGGQGVAQQPKQRDARQLGSMTVDNQAKWLMENLLND